MRTSTMKIKLLITPIIFVVWFGCNSTDSPVVTEAPNQTSLTLTHDGIAREYILYVPASYDGTSEVPLLFNFHGYGGKMNDHMNNADMRPLSDAENFILVYPQGSPLQGSPHWNPSLPNPDNKSNADDLGFIEALVNQLSADFKIDTKRIYACGYSNGAMMSFGLALHKNDLIAAVGSVSGTMLDTDITPSNPIPVIVIHGTKDGVLPYEGGSFFNSVETLLNFWINVNQANTKPIVTSDDDNGTSIEHYQYTEGKNDVSVEHYKIIGGEHVWFKMKYEGSNTNELIWDFLSRYDTDGLR